MSPKVTLEIAELHDKTDNQLVERYEQVFGEECRSRNKQYLYKGKMIRVIVLQDGFEYESQRYKSLPVTGAEYSVQASSSGCRACTE